MKLYLFVIVLLFSNILLADENNSLCLKIYKNKYSDSFKKSKLLSYSESKSLCGFKYKSEGPFSQMIISKNPKLPVIAVRFENRASLSSCESSMPISNEFLCGDEKDYFKAVSDFKKEIFKEVIF